MKINLFITFSLSILVGCTSINNTNYKSVIQVLKINSPITIDQSLKDSRFSMQYFELDSINRLGYLSKLNKNKFVWNIDDQVIIVTEGNKIIQTNGLDNDFIISSCDDDFFELMGVITINEISLTCDIRFFNPESSYLKIFYTFSLVDNGFDKKLINEEEYAYKLVQEKFEIPVINFSGTNYYWIDANGTAWKSIQTITPKYRTKLNLIKSYKE